MNTKENANSHLTLKKFGILWHLTKIVDIWIKNHEDNLKKKKKN